ncbi:serine hydrolase [Erythrobacter sp. QSSC1-22B]|uniref:serine hydrolase domain-containing protein n=1 Tax=Erythrobacter sp. QSSC1-22B TaxID=1860125 RepID=UPI000805CEE9|nr:serine hydrolase domain-containing protein [Erythrobacter sp. QSSC1-22B]OBX20382.1 serine hydrolase [Erythrobacter sp. QSSC1-22B]
MRKRMISSGLAALLLASCATVDTGSRPAEGAMLPSGDAAVMRLPAITPAPDELQVLFWDDATRLARFRDMESWFAGHEVAADPSPRALPTGAALPAGLATEIRSAMEGTGAVGVMVLQAGAVRFADYAPGFGPEQRWTSFSVAKSFTSTLLGAALRDGHIASLDDPVTQYVPGLVGSAYDEVSVRQLATMTSGVAWNEDYSDPASDVAQLNRFVLEHGPDAIVAQMRALPREAPPGEKWVYKTGETNLLGLLVENAVGMSLAGYAKENIVDAAGFEGDMFWMTDPRGGNVGGCCLSLRLADYARFGQFALEGGGDVVPVGWFGEAGAQQVDFGGQGFGYGYQWWTYPGGNFGAQGIFGQSITLVPEKDIVVAIVSNWPTASSGDLRRRWLGITAKLAALE